MAQDMPPILAPLAMTPAIAPSPTPASPAAQAVIPPKAEAVPNAVVTSKPQVATVVHPSPAPRNAKFAALVRHLTTTHRHPAPPHHVVAAKHETAVPHGMVVAPPPGYYGPGPYQRLVYAGPPPGAYGGGSGYARRYPY